MARSNYSYTGSKFKPLANMAQQGFTGEGYTGTGQNIANLSGGAYTDKGGQVYNPVAGKTWQERAASPSNIPATGTIGLDATGGKWASATPQQRNQGLKDSGYFQSDKFAQQLQAGSGGGGLDATAGDPESQLRQAYFNTFDREIDDAGLQHYMQKMAGGAPFEQIVQELRGSKEGTGFTSPNEQLVTDTFQNSLGRAPSAEVMSFYLDRLESGAITEQEFRDQVAASTEGQGYVTPLEEQTLTGQSGVVNAARTAQDQSITAIDEGLDATLGAYGEAADVYDPYYQTGLSASDLQADLSGANGPEAQARAFAEFKDSPGQQYLRDQAEQARVRQAAATGGLASGALQADLQEQAAGLAEQAYQQRFTDLGTIADRGLVAGKGRADQLSKGGDASQYASQQKVGAYTNAGNQIAYGAIAGAQLIDGALAEEGSALASLQLDAATAIEDMINQSGRGFDALIQGITQGNQADLSLVWGMLSKLSSEEIDAAMAGVQSGAASSTGESTNMLAQLLEAAGTGMSIYGDYKKAEAA